MKCTFCGYEFDRETARQGCSGCFFDKGGKKCDWVKCPSCGFELIPAGAEGGRPKAEEEARFIDSETGSLLLSGLAVGQSACVCRLDTQDRLVLRKLVAMGILPQTQLKLIQKFPAYVFETGYDKFTIDEGLARCIVVKKIT